MYLLIPIKTTHYCYISKTSETANQNQDRKGKTKTEHDWIQCGHSSKFQQGLGRTLNIKILMYTVNPENVLDSSAESLTNKHR